MDSKRKRPPVSDEDRALLDAAFAGVTPLSGPARVPKPSPGRSARRAGAVPNTAFEPASAGAVTFHVKRDEDGRAEGLRAGHTPALLDELRGKRITIAATLDLHGLRAEAAARELTQFIEEQFVRGARVVRVIHGKGLHSQDGVGTLRALVAAELTGHRIGSRVLAFATAPPQLGGLGALLVRLRKSTAR